MMRLRMDRDIIDRLNQLNQSFYTTTAQAFDSARQHQWPGWPKVLAKVASHQPARLRVADLGCGNGRFFTFLAAHLPATTTLQYLGVDSAPDLLAKALELPTSPAKQAEWLQLDLIAAAQKRQLCSQLLGTFDVVTLLGVLHHVPSYDLRQSLLSQTWELLNPGGWLVFTCWRFSPWAKAAQRLVPPATAGFTASDLEQDDYFLDWRRGNSAIRYCHELGDQELASLLDTLPVKRRETFFADGEPDNRNLYVLVQK